MLLPQIRNLRSVADYRRKQMRLKNAIRTGVAVDDEANTSANLAAEQIKQNILPVMPNQDLLEASSQDKSKQYNTALDHLKSIMSGNDATTVLRTGFPDLEQLQELNRHWGTFRKYVGDTKMSPQYFFQYWNRFRQILQATDNTGMFIPLQKGDLAEDFFGSPGGIGRPPGGPSGPSQGGPGGNGGDGGGGGGYGDGDGGGGGGGGGDPFPGFKPPSSAPSSTPASPRRAGEEKKEEEPRPTGDSSAQEQNEASTPEANFRPSANHAFSTGFRILRNIVPRRGFQAIRNNMYQEVPTTNTEFLQTGMRTKLVKKPPLPKPPKPEEFTAVNIPTEDADVAAEELRKYEEREKKKIDEEKRRQDEAAEDERRRKEAEEAEAERRRKAAEKAAEDERRRKEAEEAEAERRKKANAEKAAEDERRKKVLEEQRKKEAAARAERKKKEAAEKKAEAERKKKEEDDKFVDEEIRKKEAETQRNKEERERKGAIDTPLALFSFQELQRRIDSSLRLALKDGLDTNAFLERKRKEMIAKARKIFTGREFFDDKKMEFVTLTNEEEPNTINLTKREIDKIYIPGVNKVFEDFYVMRSNVIQQKRQQQQQEEKFRKDVERQQEQLRKAREAYEKEKKRQEDAGKKITKAAKGKLARMKQAYEKLEKQKEALERVEARVKSLNNKRAAAAAAKKVLKATSKKRIQPTNVGKPGNEESKEDPAPAPASTRRVPTPAAPRRTKTVPMDVEGAPATASMEVDGDVDVDVIMRRVERMNISQLRDFLADEFGAREEAQALLEKRGTTGKIVGIKAPYVTLIKNLLGVKPRKSSRPSKAPVKYAGRIKFGAGISAPSEPRYDQFGCYLIHVPSLSKNRLNIKFPSLASHPKIPQRIVSDELVALITKILETGQMNAPLYAALTQSDKDFFDNLAHMCKIGGKLGIAKKENNADMQRFQIVRGEILSGNDAPQLIKELKHLTLKLVTEGKIPKRSAHDLLIEISLL